MVLHHRLLRPGRMLGLLIVVRQPDGHRSESLERHVAFVLAQEAQKALVVLGLEIETPDQRLVAALGALEAAADDHPQIVPREITSNEGLVHDGPERFASNAHALEQDVRRQPAWLPGS